jgi:hypothetical protein
VRAPGRKQALTAVLAVQAAFAEPLEALLSASAPAVRVKLAAVRSLHFARFALFGPRGAPSELLFETTFDDEAVAHLAELWEHVGPELAAIFSHCSGWPAAARFGDFERFLERHARPSAALFTAHDALGVERVQADAELRSKLARFLDAHDAELRALSPLEIVTSAQTALGVEPVDGAAPRWRSPNEVLAVLRFRDWARLALTWLRAAAHDAHDVLGALWHDTNRELAGARGVTAVEALGVQRCFSHVARVKPGRFRRAALRLALRTWGTLSSALCAGSRLDGPLHAARWVLLEDGRLVFLCNHDGSFAAALAALVARSSALVSMIWSHTLGFPASFAWLAGGARDEVRLTAFAAEGELATPLWYSAYPELGASEVSDNAELGALFGGAVDARRAERVLALVRD